MTHLRVAFDTSPLHGRKTGIGFAVEAMLATLRGRDDVAVEPYLVSFRARSAAGERRLPLPARLALRTWASTNHPRADRWLGDADVVHGTNYVAPPTVKPVVVSVYDCWFLDHPEQALPDVRLAGKVLRAAINRGAVVHTSSVATEEAVRRLFPGAPVKTVHLGPLALAPPAPQSPLPQLEQRPFVLAIGTVEARKNLPTLVRAFGEVARRQPDVMLVLAGSDGGHGSAGRTAIDALGPGVSQRVLVTGRVDDAARSWLLHHAEALAYPSLDEGFGFPLLEAMQTRTPVVAARAGAIPEVAGDAAVLVDPHDHRAIADALVEVISTTTLADKLRAAGDRRLGAFSWATCAEGLVDLYGRAVRGELDDLR